jgi:hypothetical protein
MRIEVKNESCPYYVSTLIANVEGVNANIMVHAMKKDDASDWRWTPLDNDHLIVVEIPKSSGWSCVTMEIVMRKHIVNTLVKLVSELQNG